MSIFFHVSLFLSGKFFCDITAEKIVDIKHVENPFTSFWKNYSELSVFFFNYLLGMNKKTDKWWVKNVCFWKIKNQVFVKTAAFQNSKITRDVFIPYVFRESPYSCFSRFIIHIFTILGLYFRALLISAQAWNFLVFLAVAVLIVLKWQ